MSANFAAALKVILHHEGLWSDHPSDPGGCTMKGVTMAVFEKFLGRPATKDELKGITDEQLHAIYHRNYWDRITGDRLPAGVNLCLFDMAVNSGPGRAVKLLQEIVGVPADGGLGPRTLAAVAEQDALSLIRQYSEERRKFYKSLKTFEVFGRGWLRRVDEVEAKAKDMAESFT